MTEDPRPTILTMAAMVQSGPKPSGIGDDIRRAIIKMASTANLHDREGYDAANAIIDAAPGLFPLVGRRQAL